MDKVNDGFKPPIDYSNYNQVNTSDQSNISNGFSSLIKYAFVVFDEIKDSYSIDKDIDFNYHILKNGIKIKTTDYIALFSISWKNVDNYLAKKQCTTDEIDDNKDDNIIERKIVFDKELLSKLNDKLDDYYQICYINEDGLVYGASIAFRLYRGEDTLDKYNNESLMNLNSNEDEDDDEFIVVRTQRTLLEDRLKQVVTHNGILEFTNKTLISRNNELEKELNDMRTHKNNCEINLVKLGDEITSLKSTICEIDNCKSKIVDLETSLKMREEDSIRKQTEIDLLINEISNINLKSQESFTLNSKSIKELTDINQKLNDELAQVKKVLKKCTDLNSQIEINLDEKERQVNLLNAEIERLRGQMVRTEKANGDRLGCEVTLKETVKKLEFEIVDVKLDNYNQMKLLKDELDDERKISESLRNVNSELKSKINELELRIICAKTEYETLYRTYTKEAKYKTKEAKQSETKPKQLSDNSYKEQQKQQSSSSKTELKNSSNAIMLNASEGATNDAISNKQCPDCNETIYYLKEDENKYDPLTAHLESKHGVLVCPICKVTYEHGMNEYFNIHVQNHF